MIHPSCMVLFPCNCHLFKGRKTGTAWSSLLIRKIWEIKYNKWQSRNLVVHPSNINNLQLENTSADNEIKIECAMGSGPLPSCM